MGRGEAHREKLFELARPQLRREIEGGARLGGDRDAVSAGALVGGEPGGAMDAEARASAAVGAGDGDMDAAGAGRVG